MMKDKNKVEIRFAFCFPDVYEIGMSNLGMMILYNMFNQREDVWCERLFSPWPDLDKVMREQHIPLFALESQEPIKDFDFLGITLGYEMCYTNILQVLDLSGIPLKSADRGEEFPIVIGGGACAYNPEPLAEFFDLSILEKARPFMMLFLMRIRLIRRPVAAEEIFLRQQPEFREFMCLLYMRLLIKKTAPLLLSGRQRKVFPRRFRNS